MSEFAAPSPDFSAPAPRKSRGTLAVVSSVVAVVLVAGGGYAAWRFLAGSGPQPDTILPSTTFAVVSVDLDPAGGQKIEAIKTLRKLPSFTKRAGVGADSDLVKAIYDKAVGHQCPSVSYARDVQPWIGQKAALAGVLLDGKAVPVLALQTHDVDKAKAGFATLVACAKSHGDPKYGFTVTKDYVLMSDSDAHARAIAAAGAAKPLTQDADYTKWTKEAGGEGIVSGYLAPTSGRVLLDEITSAMGGGKGAGAKELEDALGPLKDRLDSFRGAAATMRFHDSGLEVSFAAGSTTPPHAVPAVGGAVGALPADTAVVAAGAVDAASITRTLTEGFATAGGGASQKEVVQGLQQMTGLHFPGDVATLLGTSISLSVGGQAPADLSKVTSPADVPVGVLVHGDPTKITRLISTVERHTGASLKQVPATVVTGKGTVAVATSRKYADALVSQGTLGSSPTFRDAVPNAATSPSLFYLSLDNGWGDAFAKLAQQQGGKDGAEIASDVHALKALGASAWTKDGDQQGLLRLVLR